jgi:hypothetical protein
MTNRPMRASLRAALAVSGLTAAIGCGGNANAEPTTPNHNATNHNTPSNVAHSEPALTPDGHCVGSWSEYSEACCARESDATWSAERGCEPTVMVGPFVPPEMNA